MLKRLRNDKGVKRYIDTMDDIQRLLCKNCRWVKSLCMVEKMILKAI